MMSAKRFAEIRALASAVGFCPDTCVLCQSTDEHALRRALFQMVEEMDARILADVRRELGVCPHGRRHRDGAPCSACSDS